MSEIMPATPDYEIAVGLATPIVNSHFDITNLYNRHGTVADAQETAAAIEPDSIVFIEGAYFSYVPPSETSILKATTYNSMQRLRDGKDDQSYLYNKGVLLDALDRRLAEVPEPDPHFWGHGLGIRRELVAKNCVVIPADVNFSSVPEDQHDDKVLDGYKCFGEHMGFTEEIFIGRGSATKRFADGVQTYREYVVHQHNREEISIGIVAGILKNIAMLSEMSDDLAMTELHKRRVYTVWGTAHAASMTGEYLARGLDVRQRVVDNEIDVLDFIPGHGENLRLLARKRVLADAAAATIAATGYAIDIDMNSAGLMDSIAGDRIDEVMSAYLHFDRLFQAMRNRRLEHDIAMQYAVPRADLYQGHDNDVLNVWNTLQDIGVAP